MDAAAALADLTEISSQVESAVVFDDDGTVLASTVADGAPSERLVRAALDLLGAAREQVVGGNRELTQLEAALREGSVFVVRDRDRSIVATTSGDPTSGLVFYDLKTCLRALAEPPAKAPTKPKRRSTKARTDA
jgi:predicted regulator of Ras-like GTPase activity (Roadblock/LC7/MglB family)